MKNRKPIDKTPSFPSFQSRKLPVIVAILMTTIVVDISLVRVYDLVNKQFISIGAKQDLFSIVSITCLALQYLLLEFIKPPHTEGEGNDKLHVTLLYKITKAVQYALGALVIYIVVQIQLTSYYNTSALLVVILGSYALCIGILVKFIALIVGWLSFKKNMIVVILFVLALGSVTVNAALAMIDTSLRLGYRSSETKLLLGGSVDVSKGKFNTLDTMYFLSFVFSFVSSWVATAVLLDYYSSRIGKFKYWLITLTPLLFFLGQFVNLFVLVLSPLISPDPFFVATLVTLIVTLSKPLGGLMLGIAFWSMARLGERNKMPVQNYLVISGLGLLMLFTSNQALLMAISPYPPFGLSTITVLGLSAYLTVIGIYTSSATVSHNAELRKAIRRLASSKLLDSLAYAEMERELESKVLKIVKEQKEALAEQTGVQPSLTEDEIKQYLEEVLAEVKKNNNVAK